MLRSYLQLRTRLKLYPSSDRRPLIPSGQMRLRGLTLACLSIGLSICVTVSTASAQLEPIPLTRSCVEEVQPNGLSVVVDDQRSTHMVYFTPVGQLVYHKLSDSSGSLASTRLVLDLLDPEPAHTRMTLTDQGVAFCYYDPRLQRVRVFEQAGDDIVPSSALEAPSATYCDIERYGSRLLVSAVVNGQLRVAEGIDADPSAGINRVWSTEVAIDLHAAGYSAIQRSSDQLWVASRTGESQLTLASRPITGGAWSTEVINATQASIGDQLRLSARSGPFTGSVWATHTPPVVDRVISSDRGFLITELYQGAWDTYNPFDSTTSIGGYHDAFGGGMRGDLEGYLYVVTREHRRSPVFGNVETLLLLRYVSETGFPNRQVLEGPHSGAGLVYTEMGIAPEPLSGAGDVVIVGHFYEGETGRLCRWSAPDQDHDALPDAYEVLHGTLVENSDTDGDGFTDGEEVLTRGTDPLVFDLPPSRCDDGLKNGVETDIDCGGGICDPCGFGQGCAEDVRDCAQSEVELICLEGSCAQASCEDQRRSQDETDIDCGGRRCEPCPDGLGCQLDQDCAEGECVAGVCFQPDCRDGSRNQDETDVDCGGERCAPCVPGALCEVDRDCQNAECVLGTCVAPTCHDARQNQDESDVDCGGDLCPPCPLDSTCRESDDCERGECLAQRCVISSCADGIRNQDESDVDCGGDTCEPCPDGRRCDQDVDCLFGQCLLNTCVIPSCQDGVLNLEESDIDCGGPRCLPCAPERRCIRNADCESRLCEESDLGRRCSTPRCDDAVQNALETDVDCGGAECDSCITGRVCRADQDCVSGVCRGGRCEPPRCDDRLRNGDERDVDCGGSCPKCQASQLCDDDVDCESARCLGGRCAAPTCYDQRQNQGEQGIDCGGPCDVCLGADQGITSDMDPYDMGEGDLSDDLSTPPEEADLDWVDAEVDSDWGDDFGAEPDQTTEDMGTPVDMMWDSSSSIMIDAARPLDDMTTMTPDQEVADRGTITTLDPQERDATSLDEPDRGEPQPAVIDPQDTYDPSVFQRERPESGCQAVVSNGTLRSSSSSVSLYLSLLLLIWYVLSYPTNITRRSR